jgi:hypothetical protein
MHRVLHIPVVAIACALAVVSAGAQTKMVTTKEETKTKEAPPRKILVITVAPDPVARCGVRGRHRGRDLAPRREGNRLSYVLPELPNPKERDSFEAKLRELGFDAVMISRLVGSDDKIKMKEGYATYATDYRGMGYWGEYVYTFEKVLVPGYLEKEKRVRVRSDLWRAIDGKGALVWTGTSETLNPRTAAQAGREVGVAVAKALAKAGLI